MSTPRGRKTAPYESADKVDADAARLRELLAATNAERLTLKNRVQALEHELSRSAEHQDAFVAGLLEEHETALSELRKSRNSNASRGRDVQTAPAVPRKAASADEAAIEQELDRLRRERDRSRELLRRLQEQRDDAQALAASALARVAELEGQVGAGTANEPTLPPAVPTRRQNQDAVTTSPTAKRPQPAELDMPAVPAVRAGARQVPELELDMDGASHAAKMAAVDSVAPVADQASAASALERRANPAERPLGRYSLRPESVEPELVHGNRSRRR